MQPVELRLAGMSVVFEDTAMSTLAGAPVTGANVSSAVVFLLVLLVLAAGAAFARQRRLATTARAVRDAVVAELERDPALTGLKLQLATRAPWNGQVVVEVAGVVGSPWYRYAVLRATQRALARTFRHAKLDDRIVVDTHPGTVPARRSAAGGG
jgi:hypothetical protein